MVSRSIFESSDVNVLQAINFTLGTSAFVALADAIPKMTNLAAPLSFGRIIYVTLLVFWSVKLLVGNHKSFARQNIRAHPRYSIFQLVMMVAMGIPLIVSAKTANEVSNSSIWLAVSMFAGVIWLIGLGIFYHRTVGLDWKKYPWWWLISGIVTIVGAGYIAISGAQFDAVAFVTISGSLLLVGIWDAYKTNTFFV